MVETAFDRPTLAAHDRSTLTLEMKRRRLASPLTESRISVNEIAVERLGSVGSARGPGVCRRLQVGFRVNKISR